MINLRRFSASTLIVFSLISNLSSYAVGESESKQNNFVKVTKESEILVDDKKSELEDKNKFLSLLGIGATSILFLFILILLFKEDKKIEIEPETKDRAKSDSKSPNSAISEDEQLIFKPDFSKQNTEKKENSNGNRTEILKPLQNINAVNIAEKKINNRKPKISSDIMGKLTIETSSVIEIDIVFELIQDLQKSGRYNNSVKQKNLGRKAIWKLGQTNDLRAIKPLIQKISRADSLEKNLILDTIAKISNHSLESINRVLSVSLENDNVEVRKDAIQDLNTLYQSMSFITANLSKMTKDSNREVRQTAAWTLEQFKQMSASTSPINQIEKGK